MITFGILIAVLAVAAFVVYRLGRNSKTVDVLKSDVKTGEKVNEILEKQRDGRVDNVGDADRLWDNFKKD